MLQQSEKEITPPRESSALDRIWSHHRAPVLFLSALVILTLLSSCVVLSLRHGKPGQNPAKVPKEGSAADTVSRHRRILLAFHRRHFIEAYKQFEDAGGKDRAAALAYLEQHAKKAAGAFDAPSVQELWEEVRVLDKKRDKNPVIRYCYALLADSVGERETEEIASIYHDVLQDLGASDVPKYRASMVAHRLASLYGRLDGKGSDRQKKWEHQHLEWLAQSAADGSYRPDEFGIFLANVAEQFGERTPSRPLPTRYDTMLLEELAKIEGVDPWITETLRGRLAFRKASLAYTKSRRPGGGEQAKAYQEYLAEAETHLTDAWERRPDLPHPAALMIAVCRFHGDRDGVDTWFSRAIDARLDYLPTYSQLRWALRPRWVGSREAMLVHGQWCLETGRFDTCVPYQLWYSVEDLLEEYEEGREVYRRPEIYALLSRMFEGYLAEPRQRDSHQLRRMQYAVTAWAAGDYAKARALFDEGGTDIPDLALKPFSTDRKTVLGQVFACTGAAAEDARAAETMYREQRWSETIPLLERVREAEGPDSPADTFIRERLRLAKWQAGLDAGEWIDIMPGTDLLGWERRGGRWAVMEDGSLRAEAVQENRHTTYSLLCRIPESIDAYEVTGTIEFEGGEDAPTYAGVCLGPPIKTKSRGAYFRLCRNPGRVIFGYGRTQVEREFPVQLTNTFRLVKRGSHHQAYVNGEEAFADWERNRGVRCEHYMFGLYAHIYYGAVKPARFRDLRLRVLRE